MRVPRNRGQILPLALFLLPVLALFIGVNGERLNLQVRKVAEQRDADTTLLLAATQQARALNAIAALNEGLQIALERGYAMAVAITAVTACAAMTLGMSPCSKAATSLARDAPPFYRKLNKLGRELAKSQDEILAWAEVAPSQTVVVRNTFEGLHSRIFLHPRLARLRVRRVGEEGFRSMGLGEEEVGMAGGGDVVRCRASQFGAGQYAQLASIPRDGNDRLSLTYISAGAFGATRELGELRGLAFREHNQRWNFLRGTLIKCESFRDIMQSVSSANFVFNLPPPYALEESFPNAQRIALGRSTSGTIRFKPLLNRDSQGQIHRQKIWAFSEARVKGLDLGKMEFFVDLTKITMLNELLENLPFLDAPLNRMRMDERLSH